MPYHRQHFTHDQQAHDAPATAVERACQIAKALFSHDRGNHDTDADTIRSVARHARLSPSTFRRFIQPSRRPKDLPLGVWSSLVGAYARYLYRELDRLQDEIDRLEILEPSDVALADLLNKARALCREVEAIAPSIHAEPGDGIE